MNREPEERLIHDLTETDTVITMVVGAVLGMGAMYCILWAAWRVVLVLARA